MSSVECLTLSDCSQCLVPLVVTVIRSDDNSVRINWSDAFGRSVRPIITVKSNGSMALINYY